MLIVDVKSGRFMNQSGRVGDKAKKRKSPAKSKRVGISGKWCSCSYRVKVKSKKGLQSNCDLFITWPFKTRRQRRKQFGILTCSNTSITVY